jgi:DNA polymerase-3 subunit delta
MKTDTKVYPIYLLYGSEGFLIEEECRRLLDRTLSPKERGLNLHVFSGEEHTGREIVQAAQTIPMFSRYRFVLVREADSLEKEEVEALLKYVRKPSPSSCLVLCAQTLGPWKGHRSEIEKVGKVVEYSRLKGKALLSWIRGRMAEKGKTLSEEGADYLVEVVGDQLHQLENALEKAYLVVGEKRSVELSDIEGVVSEVKISTVFDLTDAIGHRDVDKALGILEKVLESKTIPFRKEEDASKMGDPVPLLLSMMARQYRMIWKVKEMLSEQQGAADIAKTLKMSPWAIRNLIDQCKSFPTIVLKEGIFKCHQTDLAIKRGRGPKDLLMEKLVIDLCHPGQPPTSSRH